MKREDDEIVGGAYQDHLSREEGSALAQADHCPAHLIDEVEALLAPNKLYPWQRELLRRLFQAGEL